MAMTSDQTGTVVDLLDTLDLPRGAALDTRGDTCWLVLSYGDEIGWVRLTNDGYYTATVAWQLPTRRPPAVEPKIRSFPADKFTDAVRWILEQADG